MNSIWQMYLTNFPKVLVKYDMHTLQYSISCVVTGQILSAENWQNKLSGTIHLAFFFIPSIEASLAVDNSRTNRKLCYV